MNLKFIRFLRHHRLSWWIRTHSLVHRTSRVCPSSVLKGRNRIGKQTEVSCSDFGIGSYVAENSKIRGAKVGRFSSIGDYVRIGVGQHPTREWVTTHPAFFSRSSERLFGIVALELFAEHAFITGSKIFHVEVGNDVWIANNVTILDGIRIGDGAIIALGSFVTADVEPYAIYAGVPAKRIRYRFTPEQINFLTNFCWWDRSIDWLNLHAADFSNVGLAIEKWKTLSSEKLAI